MVPIYIYVCWPNFTNMGHIWVLYGQKSLYGAHVGIEWDKCPDSAHMGPTYTCLLGTFSLGNVQQHGVKGMVTVSHRRLDAIVKSSFRFLQGANVCKILRTEYMEAKRHMTCIAERILISRSTSNPWDYSIPRTKLCWNTIVKTKTKRDIFYCFSDTPEKQHPKKKNLVHFIQVFYFIRRHGEFVSFSREHKIWYYMWITPKKVNEKSRECHNHKPQPFPDPKRKRKPTNPNKHKSYKRTKSTKISSLFPKRGNRNTKRTEKHKNKMTHGKTYNKPPHRINHKATKSKTNTGTTALEQSVE